MTEAERRLFGRHISTCQKQMLALPPGSAARLDLGNELRVLQKFFAEVLRAEKAEKRVLDAARVAWSTANAKMQRSASDVKQAKAESRRLEKEMSVYRQISKEFGKPRPLTLTDFGLPEKKVRSPHG